MPEPTLKPRSTKKGKAQVGSKQRNGDRLDAARATRIWEEAEQAVLDLLQQPLSQAPRAERAKTLRESRERGCQPEVLTELASDLKEQVSKRKVSRMGAADQRLVREDACPEGEKTQQRVPSFKEVASGARSPGRFTSSSKAATSRDGSPSSRTSAEDRMVKAAAASAVPGVSAQPRRTGRARAEAAAGSVSPAASNEVALRTKAAVPSDAVARQLLDNWEAVWSDTHGKYYYWNLDTDEVQWKSPSLPRPQKPTQPMRLQPPPRFEDTEVLTAKHCQDSGASDSGSSTTFGENLSTSSRNSIRWSAEEVAEHKQQLCHDHRQRSRVTPIAEHQRTPAPEKKVQPTAHQFCPNCGEQCGPRHRFCASCGSPLAVAGKCTHIGGLNGRGRCGAKEQRIERGPSPEGKKTPQPQARVQQHLCDASGDFMERGKGKGSGSVQRSRSLPARGETDFDAQPTRPPTSSTQTTFQVSSSLGEPRRGESVAEAPFQKRRSHSFRPQAQNKSKRAPKVDIYEVGGLEKFANGNKFNDLLTSDSDSVQSIG
mmetsp:Transcript_147569/g.269115  ORF Transcript_147569/g.269115 Transcript_147569/m.269115 type:complete len:542 (+) Transcript_147569:168-1793(+)